MSKIKETLPFSVDIKPDSPTTIRNNELTYVAMVFDTKHAEFIVTACNYHERMKELLSKSDEILVWAEEISRGVVLDGVVKQRGEIKAVLKELEAIDE